MKTKMRIAANVLEILLGAGLLIGNAMGHVNEYWSGLGTALIVVGCIFLWKQFRYRTDKDYREAIDTQNNDERNRYISLKAWSWAGYLHLMIAAVAAIILMVADRGDLVPFASGSVCLMVFLYWVSYLILRRKY